MRPGATHVFHLYVIRVNGRDRLRESLDARGVSTLVHYPIPIHRQPGGRNVGRIAGDLRVTETYADQILSLPIYPEIEPEQLAYVAECLSACLGSRVQAATTGR